MNTENFSQGNLPQLMSHMENMGYYMDHRMKDGHFVMDLFKKYKVAIKAVNLYKCEDISINRVLQDFTKVYDALCTQEAFRQALPSGYTDSNDKYYTFNLLNTCGQQGPELMLYDIYEVCLKWASDLNKFNFSEINFDTEVMPQDM